MRMILAVLFAIPLLWALALTTFVSNMPVAPTLNDESADAIIVLTGGAQRVERGFKLFARDKGHTLFISGVGKNATLNELLAKHGNDDVRAKLNEGAAQVVLDYRAESTQTNAREAAHFIRERKLSTVRLVTATYHMPRSLMEFASVVPNVRIIADPVFPDSFRRNGWWADEASRNLVLSEFHKYWAAKLRSRVLGA